MQLTGRTPVFHVAHSLAVWALLAFILQTGVGAAQNGSLSTNIGQKTSAVVSRETYDRVLDMLFPRNDPEPSKTIYEFILRFEPSFKSESQVVIRRTAIGAEVIEYTVMDGNIYATLNTVLERTGKEDAEKMAQSIRVTRRKVALSDAQLDRWHTVFFESVFATNAVLKKRAEVSLKTGSVSLVLDGTTYQVWCTGGLDTISLTLYDVEVDTQGFDGELAIARWMNQVRREIAKTK